MTNKYTIFAKTKNVIASCATIDQLEVARRYAKAAERAIYKIIDSESTTSGIEGTFERLEFRKIFANQIYDLLYDKRMQINSRALQGYDCTTQVLDEDDGYPD